MLCRAMSKPTPPLLKAALRVLYYLARHADVGLHYEADPSDITAYSDSDLGVQKSTTGWDIRWQKATISFGSKRQASVATSSCHAALGHAARRRLRHCARAFVGAAGRERDCSARQWRQGDRLRHAR